MSVREVRPACATESLVSVEIPCVECGYILKGLSEGGQCPECGEAVARSTHDRPVVRVTRAQREWAILVLAGLLMLLWVVPSQIDTVLWMRFAEGVGGTGPRLNVPAPKIWAVTTVQRSIGYRPESLGVGGTLSSMFAVASVFLLTSRRTLSDWNESAWSFRRIVRAVIATLVGGWLGFVMCMEGLDGTDIAVGKYVSVAIGAVELPCTLLLYLWLGQLARQVGDERLKRCFDRCAFLTAGLMAVATLLIVASDTYHLDRRQIGWQIISSVFMAACLAVGLAVVSLILRLGVALFRLAWPAFSRRGS